MEMCPLTFTYPKIKQVFTPQNVQFKKHLPSCMPQINPLLSYHRCPRGIQKSEKISKVSQLPLLVHLIPWGLSISMESQTCLLETKNPINQKPRRLYTSQLFFKTIVLGPFNLSSTSLLKGRPQSFRKLNKCRMKAKYFWHVNTYLKHIIRQDNCLMDHHECQHCDWERSLHTSEKRKISSFLFSSILSRETFIKTIGLLMVLCSPFYWLKKQSRPLNCTGQQLKYKSSCLANSQLF